MKIDLHLHSIYSPDAARSSTVDAICLTAIEKNIGIICFTDHIDIGGSLDTYHAFNFAQRNLEIFSAQIKYADRLTVLNGLEFAEPNLDQEIAKEILKYPYDLILGSVHKPCEEYSWGELSNKQMSEKHYLHTLDMVKFGGIDVLAHLDFPKKFCSGFIPNQSLTKEILVECVKNNIVLEINTSSIRYGQQYPSPDYKTAQLYYDLGGKYLTIGADAHRLCDVGADYEKVLKNLPKGLKLCYFKQRKLIEL